MPRIVLPLGVIHLGLTRVPDRALLTHLHAVLGTKEIADSSHRYLGTGAVIRG